MGNSGSASKCCSSSGMERLLIHVGLCLVVLALCHYDYVHARPVSHALVPRQYYTAAVYEHAPVTGIANITEAVHANLQIYLQQAAQAAQQGADIVVFPEYGLTGLGQSRTALRQIAELVPDPKEQYSNPCEGHLKVIEGHDLVQYSLSCMARDHGLYVAANMVSYEPCVVSEDPTCPEDGFYLYNANVVYDVSGQLVARYRKWTLYYEDALNQPEKVDYSYFDTPFGRMGTFICFDILFKEPAMGLVNENNVDTMIFPTAWQSKFPLMQSLGFHESWAILNGVNLLSSELHVPAFQFTGSANYAGAQGTHNFYLHDYSPSFSKLVISNLPVKPVRPSNIELPPVKVIDEEFDTFQSIMRGDLFTFVLLSWKSHEIYIESLNTSCFLSYNFNEVLEDELYAFGIFQGLHLSAHNSYLQVCALVKCGNTEDRDSCGDPVMSADSVFEYATIHGQFSSSYVYPSVVIDSGVSTGNMSGWDFTIDSQNNRALLDVNTLSQPIVYATLYGRLYELDTENSNILKIDGGFYLVKDSKDLEPDTVSSSAPSVLYAMILVIGSFIITAYNIL